MAQERKERRPYIVRKGILRGIMHVGQGRPDIEIIGDGVEPPSLTEALEAGYELVHMSEPIPEPSPLNELTVSGPPIQLFVVLVMKRPYHVVQGVDWNDPDLDTWYETKAREI